MANGMTDVGTRIQGSVPIFVTLRENPNVIYRNLAASFLRNNLTVGGIERATNEAAAKEGRSTRIRVTGFRFKTFPTPDGGRGTQFLPPIVQPTASHRTFRAEVELDMVVTRNLAVSTTIILVLAATAIASLLIAAAVTDVIEVSTEAFERATRTFDKPAIKALSGAALIVGLVVLIGALR